MALMKWTPFQDLLNVQREMNQLIDRFFSDTPFSEDREAAYLTEWSPDVDIKETKKEFVVQAELPGLKKKDVRITYKDGVLTIEGERKQEKEEKDKNFYRVERRFGKFYRAFQIPGAIKEDQIQAKFKDGVLTIRLPKSEEEKGREIEVKIS